MRGLYIRATTRDCYGPIFVFFFHLPQRLEITAVWRLKGGLKSHERRDLKLYRDGYV